MLKVLFLCTGNSCRSQMAEGWARHLRSDRFEAYSAGIATHGLNPDAVRVMAEAGVDISSQESKLVSTLLGVPLDYVVTVCDHAPRVMPRLSREGQSHSRWVRRSTSSGEARHDRGRTTCSLSPRARRDS